MDILNVDMWEYARNTIDLGKEYPVVFITTNGTIKQDGTAVMGRGCAREARDMFPGIDEVLGKKLQGVGNIVTYLGHWKLGGYKYEVWSFPVKHHWYHKADLELIETSLHSIQGLLDSSWPHCGGITSLAFLLPKAGCGNGNRDWETEVSPMYKAILKPSESNSVVVLHK